MTFYIQGNEGDDAVAVVFYIPATVNGVQQPSWSYMMVL